MREAANEPVDDEVRALIADIRDVPMTEVLARDNSVLSGVLRLVLEQIDQAGESYAAHGSAP
jgi:hypothetical protein